MESQVQKLTRCLSSDNVWIELNRCFPQLEEVKLEASGFSEKEIKRVQDKIIDLYARHVKEWQVFEHSFHCK